MKFNKTIILVISLMMSSIQSQADQQVESRADIEKRLEVVQAQIQELQKVKLAGTDWTVSAGKQLLVLTGAVAVGFLTRSVVKRVKDYPQFRPEDIVERLKIENNTNLYDSLGAASITASVMESAMVMLDSNSINKSLEGKQAALNVMYDQIKVLSSQKNSDREDSINESVKSKRAAMEIMYAQLKKLSEEAGGDNELNSILNDQQAKIKSRISDIRKEITKLDQLRMAGATFTQSLKQVVVGLGSTAAFFISRGRGGNVAQNVGAALVAFTAAESVVVYLDTATVDNTIEDLTNELSQLEGQLPQAK
jgi:hypothetical protein